MSASFLETQFQKGVSGNPRGRPPGKSHKAIARRVADKTIVVNGEKKTVLEAALMAMMSKAAGGSSMAARFLEELRGRLGIQEEAAEDHPVTMVFWVDPPGDPRSLIRWKKYEERLRERHEKWKEGREERWRQQAAKASDPSAT